MATIKTKIQLEGGGNITLDLDYHFKITKNFELWEVANKMSKDAVKMVITPRHLKFMAMLQEYRTWYAKSITVNSCYRTKSFNDATPGADKKSRHLEGEAADLAIPGHTDAQRKNMATKWEQICNKYNEIGAINYYTHGYHCEIGSDRSYGSKKFVIRDYRGTSSDW